MEYPHLNDLSITGFRGIDKLTIGKLGRVTLFAGRNGVGKTTVLDAVRAYAARGRLTVLSSLLEDREELEPQRDEDDDLVLSPDCAGLFHNRDTAVSPTIRIGQQEGHVLSIALRTFADLPPQKKRRLQQFLDDAHPRLQRRLRSHPTTASPAVLELAVDGYFSALMPWAFSRSGRLDYYHDDEEWPPAIRCEALGPHLLGNRDFTRFWDQIALTEDETLAMDVLRLIFGHVEGVALIEGDAFSHGGRRVRVKLTGQARPVPLKALGDGATRLFAIGLALANCRDGILLLDEAENGIHYALQADFWRRVLQAADTHNVQVLATTHSKDCINGFAWAASENTDVDADLFRLERDNNGVLRAVDYTREDLRIAAEQDIEVR